MYHYVYYSYEEWGRGYIGVRSCKCLPEEDTKYFGSFYDKTFKPTSKIILAEFPDRESALAAEVELHAFYQVHKNPHFANKARQTSTKFDCDFRGRVASPETREKQRLAKLGKRLKPEHIAKMLESRKGYRHSEETKQKIREANTGDVWSEQRRINKRNERLGASHKIETKEKLRQMFSERWQCTVTGYISNINGLTTWRRNRGLDPSNRVRLPDLYVEPSESYTKSDDNQDQCA